MLAVRRSLSTSLAPAMSTSVVVAEQGPTKAVEKGYMFKREVKKFKQFDNKVEYLTTKLDDVANLIRAGSLWPMTFGWVKKHLIAKRAKWLIWNEPILTKTPTFPPDPGSFQA